MTWHPKRNGTESREWGGQHDSSAPCITHPSPPHSIFLEEDKSPPKPDLTEGEVRECSQTSSKTGADLSNLGNNSPWLWGHDLERGLTGTHPTHVLSLSRLSSGALILGFIDITAENYHQSRSSHFRKINWIWTPPPPRGCWIKPHIWKAPHLSCGSSSAVTGTMSSVSAGGWNYPSTFPAFLWGFSLMSRFCLSFCLKRCIVGRWLMVLGGVKGPACGLS